MELLICLSALLAVASGSAYYYSTPEISSNLALDSFDTSHASLQQQQYHIQDVFGQYSYGYREPLSSKQEVRTLDGITRGSYSYLDAAGKIQTVEYTADAAGFRVAATNLPLSRTDSPLKPVEETAEVAAARAQHLAAHQAAVLRTASVGIEAQLKDRHTPVPDVLLPQPVEDTAEVAAAKVHFFKLYEEEKLRHKLLHEKEAAAHALQEAQLQAHARLPQIVAASPLLTYQSGAIPNNGIRRYNYKLSLAGLERPYLPIV